MRKHWAVVVLMEVVIGAVGLFVEERFAVPGDILWGSVALAAMGGIVALFSPEIITWLRKIKWLWWRTTGKAHKVSADPVRFHFSVPEAAVTLRRAPRWKRVLNKIKRVLNKMKAWGKAGEG